MTGTISEVEKARLGYILAALEFYGFRAYDTQVLKIIAQRVRLVELDEADIFAVVKEWAGAERPSPHKLADRLNAYRSAPAPKSPGDTASAGIPLAPYCRRLESLPRNIRKHLADAVKGPEFFAEMRQRQPESFKTDREFALVRKAGEYYPAWNRMAQACLLAWELADGRLTEEMIGEEAEWDAAHQPGGTANPKEPGK